MLILFPSLTIRLFKSSMKLMFIVTENKNCLVGLCQERPDGYFSKVFNFSFIFDSHELSFMLVLSYIKAIWAKRCGACTWHFSNPVIKLTVLQNLFIAYPFYCTLSLALQMHDIEGKRAKYYKQIFIESKTGIQQMPLAENPTKQVQNKAHIINIT